MHEGRCASFRVDLFHRGHNPAQPLRCCLGIVQYAQTPSRCVGLELAPTTTLQSGERSRKCAMRWYANAPELAPEREKIALFWIIVSVSAYRIRNYMSSSTSATTAPGCAWATSSSSSTSTTLGPNAKKLLGSAPKNWASSPYSRSKNVRSVS
ncbi:hypothetical protein PENSPDRAFT_651506 [Peniophora sp. CONT]|nr:hypothetical protein PENSPDRAFT_651506 [Peniophora sp. CONT]